MSSKASTALIILAYFMILEGCATLREKRKAFIVTSEQEEISLGEEAYRQILLKERRTKNSRLSQLVERVGLRIAHVSKVDYDWEFVVLESNEKNAFCLPGGKVAFYTGILGVTENEAQVAAIMGHEVAHAVLRHAGQRISLVLGKELGLNLLKLVIGNDSNEKKLLFAALGIGSQIGFELPYSRAHESEADEVGLVYMAKAGYDPIEAVRFWEKFSQVSQAIMPEFLSTHPHSEGRIAHLKEILPLAKKHYLRSEKIGIGEKTLIF